MITTSSTNGRHDAPAGQPDHDYDRIERICAQVQATAGDLASVVEAAVEHHAPLLAGPARRHLIQQVTARLDGLDVLDDFLSDPAVDEVMVNDGREVWVERGGVLQRQPDLAPGVAEVILERVLAPLARRVDRSQPIVDARLANGARLCAVVPPVAPGGACFTVRKHRRQRFTLHDYASATVAELLQTIVAAHANVLITGATSSGKTSFLAALLAAADASDRIVVLEDTAELPIDSPHVVRLEARRALVDTIRSVELNDLVVAALRLRPDRLVIGEFRSVEVLAVVQALNTGHDGAMSTCHANSALDGLHRVETLLMQAAPSWPLDAIRQQISRSIDVIVHVARTRAGRRVSEVVEVQPVVGAGAAPSVRPLINQGRVETLSRGRR